MPDSKASLREGTQCFEKSGFELNVDFVEAFFFDAMGGVGVGTADDVGFLGSAESAQQVARPVDAVNTPITNRPIVPVFYHPPLRFSRWPPK